MNEIENHIANIGGLSKLVKNSDGVMSNEDIDCFLKEKQLEKTIFFVQFLFKFGNSTFNENISFKSVKKIPVKDSLGQLPLKFIYGFEKGEFCIKNISELLNERFSYLLVPFAQGASGDYWLYAENKVYYWHHESPDDEDVYLVSNDFEKFILKLKITKEDKDLDNEIIDVWLSDDF